MRVGNKEKGSVTEPLPTLVDASISNTVSGYPNGVPDLTLTPRLSLKGAPCRVAVVPGLQPRVSPRTV